MRKKKKYNVVHIYFFILSPQHTKEKKMSTSQRMVVIPADQYDRLKERNASGDNGIKLTSANEEKVLSLDDQMKKVLEDNTLNDTEKLYKYSQIMTKYMNYKDKTTHEGLDKSIPRHISPGKNDLVYTSEDVNLNKQQQQGVVTVAGDKPGNKESVVQTDMSSKDIEPDQIKITRELGGDKKKSKSKTKNIRANVGLSDIIDKWISM